MKLLLTAIAFLAAASVIAQVKPRYAGSFEIGMMNGSAETNGYLQTSHGVQYQNWFAGLSTGIDYYRFRTVPVLFELKKQFSSGTVRPFVSFAAGTSLPWLMASEKNVRWIWWQGDTSDYYKGLAMEASLGVVLRAKAKPSFTIQAGWSQKNVEEQFVERSFLPSPEPGAGIRKTIDYRLNRLFVGFAVNF